MSRVVVVTQFAEGITAAFEITIRTNRCSTIATLRDGGLGAWHTAIATAGYVFDFTELVHGLPRQPLQFGKQFSNAVPRLRKLLYLSRRGLNFLEKIRLPS